MKQLAVGLAAVMLAGCAANSGGGDPGPTALSGGETCESQGYAGGTLACSGSCALDTSACTTE